MPIGNTVLDLGIEDIIVLGTAPYGATPGFILPLIIVGAIPLTEVSIPPRDGCDITTPSSCCGETFLANDRRFLIRLRIIIAAVAAATIATPIAPMIMYKISSETPINKANGFVADFFGGSGCGDGVGVVGSGLCVGAVVETEVEEDVVDVVAVVAVVVTEVAELVEDGIAVHAPFPTFALTYPASQA